VEDPRALNLRNIGARLNGSLAKSTAKCVSEHTLLCDSSSRPVNFSLVYMDLLIPDLRDAGQEDQLLLTSSPT
jgi:hypothetical protein